MKDVHGSIREWWIVFVSVRVLRTKVRLKKTLIITTLRRTEAARLQFSSASSSARFTSIGLNRDIMTVQVWCLSFRQPYAGLILDGVKTIESRWRPLLAPLENGSLAIHIARRDWEGAAWRAVLSGPLGMNQAQIEAHLESGERFGRGVVAGLVDVGGTWQCPTSLQGEELQYLEQSAILIGLQEKYLTHLSNPRWLKEPLSIRGGRDLWTVEIPAELLP